MFTRILVPLDGSQLAERALAHAAYLAQLFHSELTLLSVLEPDPSARDQQLIDPLTWQLRKSESELYLQSLVRRLLEQDIQAQHVLLEGRSGETIVSYAQQEHVDLLVMSSHGQGGLSRWDIGSTVQKVLSKVYTPVLVVRAYRPPAEVVTYQRILVPLDSSRRAECSLPVAIAFAEASQADILLATVLRRPELPLADPSPDLEELANRLVERTRQVMVPYLAELKNRLTVPVETFILEGVNATRPLHDLAEQEDVDLVLLCAHGYSEALEHPYGSVVTNYLLHGTRPVLVIQDVRPEQARPTLVEQQAEKYGRR